MSNPQPMPIEADIQRQANNEETFRDLHNRIVIMQGQLDTVRVGRKDYKRLDSMKRKRRHDLEDLLFRAVTGIEKELEIPF